MDELVAARSANGEIEFELAWPDRGAVSREATAAEATMGRLCVCLHGRPVWHGARDDSGIEWPWIELLEFLSEYWVYLTVEDGLPLSVAPGSVPRMRATAEEEIAALPRDQAEVESEHLEAFCLTHNLAEAMQGAVSPPLWVFRDGDYGWAASTSTTATVPFAEMLDLLAQVGGFIAARLAGLRDERSRQALRAWQVRDEHDQVRYVEAATGFSLELAQDVSSALEWDADHAEPTPESRELLAAARLVGPQPMTALEPIFDAIDGLRQTETADLDRLADQASMAIEASGDEPPFAQGYALAEWLRSQPGVVGSTGRVNPDAILERWNVPVIETSLGLIGIDAIGCWGPRRGPAVLLNRDRRHASSSGRLRATLAHEICHLLVDRSGSLPLAEVLGGRTSEHVERRARAFAAELLLPRRLAGELFGSFDGDDERALRSLRARFGVSSALLGWQVRNSDVPLTPRSRRFVDRLVGETTARPAW